MRQGQRRPRSRYENATHPAARLDPTRAKALSAPRRFSQPDQACRAKPKRAWGCLAPRAFRSARGRRPQTGRCCSRGQTPRCSMTPAVSSSQLRRSATRLDGLGFARAWATGTRHLAAIDTWSSAAPRTRCVRCEDQSCQLCASRRLWLSSCSVVHSCTARKSGGLGNATSAKALPAT
jgi:hypothetical protein